MGWLVITLTLGGVAAIYGFLKRVNQKYVYSSLPLDDLAWGSSFTGNVCTFLKALSCVGDSPNFCCTDLRYIIIHKYLFSLFISSYSLFTALFLSYMLCFLILC